MCIGRRVDEFDELYNEYMEEYPERDPDNSDNEMDLEFWSELISDAEEDEDLSDEFSAALEDLEEIAFIESVLERLHRITEHLEEIVDQQENRAAGVIEQQKSDNQEVQEQESKGVIPEEPEQEQLYLVKEEYFVIDDYFVDVIDESTDSDAESIIEDIEFAQICSGLYTNPDLMDLDGYWADNEEEDKIIDVPPMTIPLREPLKPMDLEVCRPPETSIRLRKLAPNGIERSAWLFYPDPDNDPAVPMDLQKFILSYCRPIYEGDQLYYVPVFRVAHERFIFKQADGKPREISTLLDASVSSDQRKGLICSIQLPIKTTFN